MLVPADGKWACTRVTSSCTGYQIRNQRLYHLEGLKRSRRNSLRYLARRGSILGGNIRPLVTHSTILRTIRLLLVIARWKRRTISGNLSDRFCSSCPFFSPFFFKHEMLKRSRLFFEAHVFLYLVLLGDDYAEDFSWSIIARFFSLNFLMVLSPNFLVPANLIILILLLLIYCSTMWSHVTTRNCKTVN